MGKKEIPGESSSKKEKKPADKLDKKSKKDRSPSTKQPSQPSTDIASEQAESHEDDMAVDEPVGSEPKRTKKASKKRRLELETSGNLHADIYQPEDSEAPKKKKKKKDDPESQPDVFTSSSMDVDGQQALAGDHPLDAKGAGPSNSNLKKGEKKSKNKKKDKEHPESSSLVPLLSSGDISTEERPEPLAVKEDKKRKKDKNKEKNSEPLAEAEVRVSSKKKSKSKAQLDEATTSKRKHRSDFADPQSDESLDPQARKALEYTFTQFNDPSEWKFNKAKQNWILRNVWSSEMIPENYFPLAMEYISKIQGGSRDKLKEQCNSVLKEPVASPESNGADNEKTMESDPKTDSPTPKPKSILKSTATNTSQPVAGAIIAAPAPQPTVDIQRERAKLLLVALTSSSWLGRENSGGL
ncbi:hypothetical protein EST38_g649 [Candolleomyces aberdarensis]|uniref:WKF domain-containing protein n=1 Tax=Candolleomyces aberdarensis TaxID=2316362 RepID=A0A4Q2DZ12_9AGAR|nr:hypothetical protein EST38_g649 [Candolleomyces aberdarensis]